MSATKFYQCCYCKIYFNHEGEERTEQPLNFNGDHGACQTHRDEWKAELLRRAMIETTKEVFSN